MHVSRHLASSAPRGSRVKPALFAILFAATLYAQSPDRPKPQNRPVADAATPATSWTTLQAELIRSVDARKAEPGDIVIAQCRQDLKVHGEILIPKNAKLVGHVVEAQKKGRGTESTLGIAFDKAVMRDGRELPLAASIQGVAPPSFMADEGGESDFRVRHATPPPSGLLPGAVKSVPAESSGKVALLVAPGATGAVGIQGLQLESGASVIHSNSQNVRLESGTRLILRVSFP